MYNAAHLPPGPGLSNCPYFQLKSGNENSVNEISQKFSQYPDNAAHQWLIYFDAKCIIECRVVSLCHVSTRFAQCAFINSLLWTEVLVGSFNKHSVRRAGASVITVTEYEVRPDRNQIQMKIYLEKMNLS